VDSGDSSFKGMKLVKFPSRYGDPGGVVMVVLIEGNRDEAEKGQSIDHVDKPSTYQVNYKLLPNC
jgi:hypothetical protein